MEHFKELANLGKKLNITDSLILLKNVTMSERCSLLKNSVCLLYTPENEHFGIVPVEAMYCQTPVIACNSGGPLESVKNNETGFLLKSDDIESWSEKMVYLLNSKKEKQIMG